MKDKVIRGGVNNGTTNVLANKNIISDGDEEDDIMYYEVPTYMDIQPCELFNEEIRKRRDFASFVNSIEGLDSFVNTFVRSYSSNHIVSWIGGSRSWKRIHEQHFRNEPLDILTESAVLSAGNFDVFMIFDSKQLLMDKFKEIKRTIEIYVKELAVRLVDNYRLEIKYVKGSNLKEDESLEMCALFPCKSIAVELTFVSSSKRKHSRNSNNNSNGVIISRSSSSTTNTSSLNSSSSSSPSPNRQKHLPNVNDKLLLYIEMSHLSHVNIPLFRSELLDGNYLNPNGVLVFSQFIKSPRTDKGINVDVLRDYYIKRVVQQETNLSTLLYRTADKYKEIFGNSQRYHKDFLDYLYMKAVYKLHEQEHHYDVEKYYTFNVMETLRPMINSCVVLFSNVLKATYQDNQTLLLLVGGDAMRRYKDDITTTSDIDTKLYYDKHMKRTQKEQLTNLILAFMSLFVTVLNFSYEVNLDDFYKLESNQSKSPYTIFLPKLNQYTTNHAIDHTINKTRDINHFRVRYIEESCEFPVDLFSIDLSIPVIVRIHKNTPQQQEFRSHITVPVFDMVLQKNDGSVNTIDSIHNNNQQQSVVPVASLHFLKKDLDNTYSNVKKTRMRFNNDKVEKDKKRLDELYQLDQTDYSPTLDRLFEDKDVVLDNRNDIRRLIKRDATVYLKKLKGVISKNHKRQVLKHKIPFRQSKFDDIESSSATYDFESNLFGKLNASTAFSNTIIRGGDGDHKRGERIARYIRKRNDRLYKLIKLNKSCDRNSLELDKYLFEFLNL